MYDKNILEGGGDKKHNLDCPCFEHNLFYLFYEIIMIFRLLHDFSSLKILI
jgi:hypothetical protein